MGNGAKVKDWLDRNQEGQAKRSRDAYKTLRDPKTGRLLRYSLYADRELLVMLGGDQENPELAWLHYDEVAQRNSKKNWISHTMLMKFGRNVDLEQRCWYSGMQLYLVPYKVFENLGRQTPWKCSREHLVCERNGGRGNGVSNIVIAGRYLNNKIGHSPLPLKVLLRQELAKRDCDRENPTWSNTKPFLDALIEIENGHRLGNHYPWQPWAFEAGTREHRIAEAFHKEMRAEEAAFLALDDVGRRQWLDEFVWRW